MSALLLFLNCVKYISTKEKTCSKYSLWRFVIVLFSKFNALPVAGHVLHHGSSTVRLDCVFPAVACHCQCLLGCEPELLGNR